MSTIRRAASALLVLSTLTAGPALAQYFVDANTGDDTKAGTSWNTAFLTINKGLLAASGKSPPNNHVLVADGTYGLGGVDNAPITLLSDAHAHGGFKGYIQSTQTSASWWLPDGRFRATKVLGLPGGGPAVITAPGGMTNATLDGFLIANGNAPGLNDDGGGVLSANSWNVVLENLTFTNNMAGRFGGAVCQAGGTLEVDRCVFTNNWALKGAGFYLYNHSMAHMCNATFSDNGGSYGSPPSDKSTLAGGAIYLDWESSFTGANCLMHDNIALLGGGIFIHLDTQPTASDAHTLRHSTLAFNQSSGGGAGIHITESASSMIEPHGQIYIDNSILWDNIGGSDLYQAAGAFPTFVRHSDVGTWQGPASLQFDAQCINLDPVFLDPAGRNLRLNPINVDPSGPYQSPCIDTASDTLTGNDFADVDENPSTTAVLPLDLDLQPRQVDFPGTPNPDPNGYHADMGAYETPIP